MRIFCFLFFTIALWKVSETFGDIDADNFGAVIDAKLVDYDDNTETDYGTLEKDKSNRERAIKNFVGTNLFGVFDSRRKCFSSEDVALLSARRDFESLMPKDFSFSLLDDEQVRILIQYFFGVHQVIDRLASSHMKVYAQKAFYDTLGGYLNHCLIPIARYSFYAGFLRLNTVMSVLDLHSECKISLNTNGGGWRPLLRDFLDLDEQVESIKIFTYSDQKDTSCLQFDLLDEHSAEPEDILVPLPRLDPEENGLLGNMWLPFKSKQNFDLQSDSSAFVLLRYYELTTRCYYSQRVQQDTFNKRLKMWILENIEVHLHDDILYPGLGAVLRVAKTIRLNEKDMILKVPSNSTNNGKQQKRPSNIWLDDDQFQKKSNEHETNDYIYLAIGIAILVLFVVFLGVGLVVLRRILARDNKQNPREGDTEASRKLTTRKRKGLSESRSLTSSLQDAQALKDFTSTRRQSNPNNDAPIIETSMDSDSPRTEQPKNQNEVKAKNMSRHKQMLNDERKRFSIAKKKKLQKMEEKKLDKTKKETW